MSHGESASQVQSQELPKPAETPLDAVVKDICADAKRTPAEYARDAIVAEGGE